MGSAIDHVVRVTVRIQADSYLREADLAIPSTSSVADVIEDVTALLEAPRISRPWQALNPAGVPLPMTAALGSGIVDQGGVIVLLPQQDSSRIVLRDAAEALSDDVADVPHHSTTPGILIAIAVLVGAALVGMIAFFPPLSLPPAGIGAAIVVFVTAVVIAQPHLPYLPSATLWVAGATVAWFMASPVSEKQDLAYHEIVAAAGWALLSAAAVTVVLGVIFAARAAISPRMLAGLGSTSILLGLAGFVAIATDSAVAGACATIVCGIVAVVLIPRVAGFAAGLKVPILPSAGQDLSRSDVHDPNVEDRARCALRLQEGMHVGCAVAINLALMTVAFTVGGAFVQALGLGVGLAMGMHALRHRGAICTWALASEGFVGIFAAGYCAMNPQLHHVLQAVIAGAIGLAGITSWMWLPRIRDISPTTINYLEKAETLALAACLPLAAHVAGLFSWMRGWG